jgi:hypothetical protein
MSLQEKLEALKETTLLKIKGSAWEKRPYHRSSTGDERSFCGRTAEGGELCQRDS